MNAALTGNPAENLTGQILNHKWIVEERIKLKDTGSTGGFFSIPYRLKHVETGQRAFMKVLDVVKAIRRYGDDGFGVAETLSRVGSAHLFEVMLMQACDEKRLNKVVRALDSGELQLEIVPLGKIGFPFLIFELADGDTHRAIQIFDKIDVAWWFHTLHQVAIGLQQLHGIEIAHQDLKASNVVFFGERNPKITDLGRAVRKGFNSLNDKRFFAGDASHAPPEYSYGYSPAEWSEKHLSTDLYLLGSLAFIFFGKMPMTYAVFSRTPPELLPQNYHGKYEDIIPVLTSGLGKVLVETGPLVPESIRDLFLATIYQLCHPDPAKRGHPQNHKIVHGQKYSVERFVSGFRRMALTAEMQIKK
jgi:eukaryotic-like serine/threonine-protein kinase